MEFTQHEKDLLLRAARIILDNEINRKVELERQQRRDNVRYLIDNVITTKE